MNKKAFAREVRRADFIARYLWPMLRIFLRKHLSRRCRRCVLPESYAAIRDDGVCIQCHQHIPRTCSSGESAEVQAGPDLEQLLRSHQGLAPGDHDALVLFSGGKDSAYLLHRLTRDYPGLRIVTVLVDNGFMSPFALGNAARVREKFDVDHFTVSPKTSLVKRAFHYALTHLDSQRGYSIVDLLDGFITFDTARSLAARMEIPLIIAGVSKVQAENVFGLKHFDFPSELEQAALQEHAGTTFDEVFAEQETRLWWDESKWTAERVPRFILPFVVWDPDEQFILEEVNRLGLIDKNRTSPLLTNNTLIPVIGLAEMAKFGHCCFEVEFAKMVRDGKSERRYWIDLFEMLEYSAKTGRWVNKSVVQTLEALGLTKQDIGLA